MSFARLMTVVFMCFFSSPSFAGGFETQDGGYVIFCEAKIDTKAYFLDYFVGTRRLRIFDGPLLKPILGSPYKKVQRIIDRLREPFPRRAALYERYLAEYQKQIVFVDEMPEQVTMTTPLPEWPILLSSCNIRQMIVQIQRDHEVFYKTYKIIWNQMSYEQKSYAILHEIMLRDYLHRYPSKIAAKKVQDESFYLAYWATKEYPLEKLQELIPGFSDIDN